MLADKQNSARVLSGIGCAYHTIAGGIDTVKRSLDSVAIGNSKSRGWEAIDTPEDFAVVFHNITTNNTPVALKSNGGGHTGTRMISGRIHEKPFSGKGRGMLATTQDNTEKKHVPHGRNFTKTGVNVK